MLDEPQAHAEKTRRWIVLVDGEAEARRVGGGSWARVLVPRLLLANERALVGAGQADASA